MWEEYKVWILHAWLGLDLDLEWTITCSNTSHPHPSPSPSHMVTFLSFPHLFSLSLYVYFYFHFHSILYFVLWIPVFRSFFLPFRPSFPSQPIQQTISCPEEPWGKFTVWVVDREEREPRLILSHNTKCIYKPRVSFFHSFTIKSSQSTTYLRIHPNILYRYIIHNPLCTLCLPVFDCSPHWNLCTYVRMRKVWEDEIT